MRLRKGATVETTGVGRTATWPRQVGTVTRVGKDYVRVAWHGTAVEDDMAPDEVRVVPTDRAPGEPRPFFIMPVAPVQLSGGDQTMMPDFAKPPDDILDEIAERLDMTRQDALALLTDSERAPAIMRVIHDVFGLTDDYDVDGPEGLQLYVRGMLSEKAAQWLDGVAKDVRRQ